MNIAPQMKRIRKQDLTFRQNDCSATFRGRLVDLPLNPHLDGIR
jgi:hypothetical protein